MRLLEIIGANLAARDMRRNCENRHGASMAIEQPVDEVKVAGIATPGADCQLAGDVRVGARVKGRHFLVADVNPFDGFLSPHLVEYPVERIADDPVDSLHSGCGQRVDQAFRHGRHSSSPVLRGVGTVSGLWQAVVYGVKSFCLWFAEDRTGDSETTLTSVADSHGTHLITAPVTQKAR